MITCYGDSLTYGFGISQGKKWIDLVNAKGYTLVNRGQNGATLLQIRQAIKYDQPQGPLFVMGGTNDFAIDLSVDLVLDVYKDLASYLKDKGNPYQLGIPLPANPDNYMQKSLALKLEDLHKQMLEIFPRDQIVDFYGAFVPYDDHYFFDDVHPNARGAKKMADVFLNQARL